MKSIIIGKGEVGRALHNILGGEIMDKMLGGYSNSFEYDVIHICFPYSDKFIDEVDRYQKLFNPKYTIIHSTVPVGTSRACGAIHSPIRGIHPELEEGIRTFVKFLGGDQSSEVADIFRKKGIKVMLFDDQETTEALKLFDTEYYRACIEFAHRVKDYCDKNKLNYAEVYTLPNITYNEGYDKLGHKEFIRPVLEPIIKKIGGHCILENSKLIELSEKKAK
jgi:hypothetical protein